MPASSTASRTWDATITIAGETVPASDSRWDTLRETAKAARSEAAEMIRAGFGSEAWVTMYKTTKARGREEDRSGGFLWTEANDSAVYVDRCGC